MPFLNTDIARRYVSKFYPAVDFLSVRAVDSDSHQLESYTNAGLTVPSVQEVNGTGLPGVQFRAASHVIRTYMPVPRDVDFGLDVQFRVWFSTGSSTLTDGVTWKLFVTPITKDSGALVAATTALSTPIAADVVTGAYKVQASPAGILSGATIDTATADFLSIELELDATDVDLEHEGVYALGVELAYVSLYATDTGARVAIQGPWS